jgi:4-hydroxybenzoate polyprenyltransferase
VSAIPAPRSLSALQRLKLFFALSRTPHGLLDMATPAVAALLWHGSIPSLRIILVGLITVFAGYTAVYALNDLVDSRVDRRKLAQGGFRGTENYLDAVLIRHPLAQGLLTFKEAILWTAGWALLTLLGAYLLNPVCALIFLAACLLEAIYCLMWRTSHLRTLIMGAVKTSGAMAAVFAVDPGPSLPFLVLLFLWLFFWEIGGQNIPADWTDIKEDRALKATTIPLRLGLGRAKWICLSSLVLAVALNAILLGLSRVETKLPLLALSAAAGLYLLLIPAYRLLRTRQRSQASILFNRASYYPLALLVVVGIVTMI